MRKYAQVPVPGSEGYGEVGVVSCVFDHEPEWAPESPPATIVFVDVTGLDPMPAPGWTYDFDTQAFTPPPGWVPPEAEVATEGGDTP